MIHIQAVANTFVAEGQIEVLGLAEQSSGEGKAFVIQVPLEREEEDEYCLSTETGASYYGGLERIDIDSMGHRISISLSFDACTTLGLPQVLDYQLNVPWHEEAAFFTAVERFAQKNGIETHVSQ